MKYLVLISSAIVLTISACKTPYKATDQTGAMTDSTATVTDTATAQPAMNADSSLKAADSMRTSPMDSVMIDQSKDSAFHTAPADSARTNEMMDSSATKPTIDSMNTQKPDSSTQTPGKLNTDSSAVSVEAPASVAAAFDKQYPGAANMEWSGYDSLAAVPIDMRLTGWKKMDAEDHMVKFDFKDQTHYAWYDANGKWVGTATPMDDVSKLPAAVKTAVNNAIKTRYNGFAVSKMNLETQPGKKAYEIELTKEDSKVRMLVTSAGKATQIFKYTAEKKD
jgi:hypothetical protein